MESNTDTNVRINPLLAPLIGVSVLLAAAAGTAAVLWSNQGHQNAPAATAAVTPRAAVKEPVSEPKKAASPSRFDTVAGHLDKDGTFYLYLDTAQWLNGLGKQLEALRDLAFLTPGNPLQDPASRESVNTGFTVLNDLITKSGLEEIAAVGASSVVVEPGVSINKLFIHHPTDKANGFLWSAFGKAPHHLDIIDLLPLDTALATSSDLDLTNTLAGLREEFAKAGVPNSTFDGFVGQISTQLGVPVEDLLKTLDGPIGVVLTLDKAQPIVWPMDNQQMSFPTPRLAFLLHVKDDRIFNLIDKTLAADPSVQKRDTPDLRIRTMPAPLGPTMPWLSPMVAQWSGGYLLIASNESLVNDMIAAQKTGKGLKSLPEFTKLLAGLPQEGNGIQIVMPVLGDTLQVLQRDAMKNQPSVTPDQQALMEKLFSQKAGPVSVCSISTHLPDGWSIVSKGANGMNMLAGPSLVVPIAIAAGVAIPVYSQMQKRDDAAKEQGNATKSLSNAKDLVTACRLYALDHDGKFPPKLEALVPDYLADEKLLISPFRLYHAAGYIYTPGHIDTDPRDTIIIEDRFALGKHFRVVARIDGSGEAIPLPKNTAP